MKKLFLTGAVAFTTVAALAQGQILVGNNFAGSFIMPIFGPDPGNLEGTPLLLQGTGYTFQFWAGKDANSLQPLFTTTFRTANGNKLPAGLVSGETLVTIPGVDAGTGCAYQIRVWNNADGTITNWAAAQTAWGIIDAGTSAVVQSDPLGGTDWQGNLHLPVPNTDDWVSFSIGPGCLGPYFMGFDVQPTNQTVVAGGTATFVVGATACPPRFQWYFDGAPVAFACSAVTMAPGSALSICQITNVQPADAGTYYAEWLGEWHGMNYTSAAAVLTVLLPPAVTAAPRSQTAETGANVGFSVRGDGSEPLTYQWLSNGTNLPGGAMTTPYLSLPHVQPALAGTYWVVITNVAGAVTSAPAMLSVIPPVERRLVPALSLFGQTGNSLNVEDADALGPSPNWTALDSVMLTASPQWYFDLSTPLPPQRSYRAWHTNVADQPPALTLNRVPALTLTGRVGDSSEIDYINQFGPTDAWVKLDTVKLTDTSQFYFDTSAPGQPPRLWRVAPAP